jgi:hypothetical protein
MRSKRVVSGTYGTQLTKEWTEVGATCTTELFFEEIEVDEYIRYRVFVYLLDGSICEEVLYIHNQSQVSLSLSPYFPCRGLKLRRRRVGGRTMRHSAIYAVAA